MHHSTSMPAHEAPHLSTLHDALDLDSVKSGGSSHAAKIEPAFCFTLQMQRGDARLRQLDGD